jgi:hypothetical protein
VFSEISKDQMTKAIVSAGHSADIRGERLDVKQFVELSDKLSDIINQTV